MATVSVIVPNYNHAPYLRRRLDSILGQTYQDFELILLDDCSTDESREILSAYAENPRVRLEFNASNSGSPFKQWNKGVGMARGKYVWIAESDDYADARLLERLVAILEAEPEVTFAYSRSWMVNENDDRTGHADWYLAELDREHWERDFVVDGTQECRRFFVLTTPMPNASAVVFRKKTYEKIGGADERLRVSADYKVWAAMALEGKIGYVAEPLNYYRTHAVNVRTKSYETALDVAEQLGVTQWITEQFRLSEGLPRREIKESGAVASDLSVRERMEAAKQSLAEVWNWNVRHNHWVAQESVRTYLAGWELKLAGREFELFPPNRWRFFRHRLHFYQRAFGKMDGKKRVLDLAKAFGALLIGYRHRHWPERAYERILRKMALVK